MLERFVRHGFYPAVLISCVSIAYLVIAGGSDPGFVVSAVSLALIPLCFAFERWFPATPHWRLQPREAFTDFLHMVVSNPIPMWILRAFVFGGLVSISESVTASIGVGLWPTAAPLIVQTLLAWWIGEFANYVIHRGMHETALWPLHAVHHCSPRMYFLLAMRKHPLQSFITYGGRIGLLWFLGVTPEALALYTVIVSANSSLQHANVRMDTGALSRWLATPEVHRLHHSSREDELNTNYGDSIIVYDRLFGTYLPPHPQPVAEPAVGLPGFEVPQTYLSHLKLPFVWNALVQDAGADTPRESSKEDIP